MHKRADKEEQIAVARQYLDDRKLRQTFNTWRCNRMIAKHEREQHDRARQHHERKLCAVAFQALRVYRYADSLYGYC